MILKTIPVWVAAALGCAANASAADATVESSSTPDYRPFSISAEAGTTGIGGAARWRFSDHFGLRAGMDYFQYSDSREVEGINYDAKLRLQSEPVTLDIYPWKNHSFYVSLGVGFNQNRLKGSANPTGNINIGNNTYTPAQVGTLNLRVEQQPVNPYLSIGGNFFYFDSAHRWALAGELGVMYTGDVDVELNSTGNVAGLAADIERERQQVEDTLNDFQFWPVAKLAVTFSF